MKNTFTTLGIFAVLLLTLGVISAATLNGVTLTTDITSLSNVSPGETYAIVATVTNNNGTDLYMDFGVSGWTWNITKEEILDGETRTFAGTLTIPSSGNKNAILNLYETSVSSELFDISELITLSYSSTSTANTLCELEGYDEDGDLEISDFDINIDGEGSDDEWQYLDNIEVAVEIENTNNDDDIDDVEIEIRILDNKIENGGNDVTNDFDFDDEILTGIGKLRDGDEEVETFLIEELPADLDDGTYYMYIMAYEDGNKAEQCVSESSKLDDDFFFKFTVESVDYDESVVARGTDLPLQLDTHCGQQNLEISIPVYNLGSDEEEKVLVSIHNTELQIDDSMVIDDLDNGDKEVLTFFVDIPSQLTQEKYNLDISVYFDWDSDEDDDNFISYDEETSESIRLNILGCKAPAPTIAANLGSTTELEEELVIKATIKNNGELNDFIITPTGFETWAELISVEPGTLSIASGNSEEVIITLLPKQSGSRTFRIETLVDGENYVQPISVNIKGKPSILSGLGLSDAMLYLIAGIIVLLVLIFLVLIIKIVRKPNKREF